MDATFDIETILDTRGSQSLVRWKSGIFHSTVIQTFSEEVDHLLPVEHQRWQVWWKDSWIQNSDFVNSLFKFSPAKKTKRAVDEVENQPCPEQSKRRKNKTESENKETDTEENSPFSSARTSRSSRVSRDSYNSQRDPQFKQDCNQLWINSLQYYYFLHSTEPSLKEFHLDGSEAATFQALVKAGANSQHIQVANHCADTCKALRKIMPPNNVHEQDAVAYLKTKPTPFNAAYIDACGDVDTVCCILTALLSHCAQDTLMVAATFKTPRAGTKFTGVVRHLKKIQKDNLVQGLSSNVEHAWLQGVSEITKVFEQHNYACTLLLSRPSSPFIFVIFTASKQF